MVVGEIGLACVRLIAAGLMLHSFVNLLKNDPGFRPQQVMTASISLPLKKYKAPEDSAQFYSQLDDRLAAIPGVESSGIGTDLPWTGYDENAGGFTVEGRDAAFNDKTTARFHGASTDYFRAIGVQLSKGRFFTKHDDLKSPLVVIVNETFARLYWPGEVAIGKRFTFADEPKEKDWFTVVGIVRDVKDHPDSKEAHPAFWWPMTQLGFNILETSLAVRATADTGPLVSCVRQCEKLILIWRWRMSG